MIHQKTVDQVRNLPIEEVIKYYVHDLKRKGSNYSAFSPFSDERTPSFSVSPSKGIFKCFSTGKGGDAISFVMKYEKVEFLEAVKIIATNHNLEIVECSFENEDERKRYQKEQQEKASIKIALNYASEYWSSNELPKIPKTRVWNKSIRERFQIGYANNSWTDLLDNLKKEGFSEEILEKADLIGFSKKNTFYDKFRNRIIFPVCDRMGKIVGFVGRTCSEENKESKYFYSSEKVWKKGNFLFGLHLAKKSIEEESQAYLVEGHTDVIAMHRKGRSNTVGIGGSSLSQEQVNQLKKYTNSVIIIPDNDIEKKNNPGINALHENAHLLIKNGFYVKVLIPFNTTDKLKNSDPEEFLNQFNPADKEQLETWFNKPSEYIKKYLFNQLYEHARTGDKEKIDAINKLSEVITTIPNPDYRNMLNNEMESIWGDYKLVKGKKAAKEKENTEVKKIEMKWHREDDWNNRIPEELDWDDVEEFFLTNGYFEFGNRVWFASENYKDKNRLFYHKSNFVFEVLFHLYDDEFPKRLVKMVNVQGKEMIVDVRTDDMSSATRFKQFAERCGNFLWKGGANIELVKEYQFANETSGVLLETLGHQKQGFYVFSNGAYDYKFKTWIPSNDNGVVEVKHKHYYVPSGNKVYADNEHKYGTEKMFRMKQGTLEFAEWSKLFLTAYKENAMIGTMYIIATLFSDHVFEQQRSFPLMFLFGKGGSGKGAYYKRMLALFGDERQPLKLSSKANTDKGMVRTLAQYANAGILMDEYIKDRVIDEFLKSIYDRDGYAKAVRDSRFGTETTPCLSSVMVTGNEAPTDEPLLQRMFFIEINKGDYSESQREAYRKLLDEEAIGVGQVGIEILEHRLIFEDQFKDAIRKCNDEMKKRFEETIPIERIRGNMSVLLATYDILYKVLQFPFNREQLITTMYTNCLVLINKIQTGSEVSIFFNVFQFMYQRGEISEFTHYRINGNELCLRMNLIYAVYQKFYQELEKKRPPVKKDLTDALKSHESYITSKAVKFKSNGTQSCLIFDLSKTGVETMDFNKSEPSTSNQESEESTKSKTFEELSRPDLPFG